MYELELLSDYLLQNGFAKSYDDAIHIIPLMSESWIRVALYEQFEYLNESRRFKALKDPYTGKLVKVKQKKTPLTKTVQKFERGYVYKDKTSENPPWTVRRAKVRNIEVLNPDVVPGLAKQGATRHRPDLVKRGLLPHIPSEHFKSLELDYRPSAHGIGGSQRGVKKVKGQKPEHTPETSISKLKRYKETKKSLQQQYASPTTTETQRRSIERSIQAMRNTSPLDRARARAERRRQSR